MLPEQINKNFLLYGKDKKYAYLIHIVRKY